MQELSASPHVSGAHMPHDIHSELRAAIFELRTAVDGLSGYMHGSVEWIHAKDEQVKRHDRLLLALAITLVIVVILAAAMIVRTDMRVDSLERRVYAMETHETVGLNGTETWDAVSW